MRFKDLTGDEKVARVEAWRAGKIHEDGELKSYYTHLSAKKARIKKALAGVLKERAGK